MDSITRLAKAIRRRAATPQFVYGVWVAAESVDSDLSQVRIAGSTVDGEEVTLRFVPKGKHVTGLTTTSTVLMTGSPLCIIAEVVGDATLAEI